MCALPFNEMLIFGRVGQVDALLSPPDQHSNSVRYKSGGYRTVQKAFTVKEK
jgi:hypothetical protein